VNAYEAADILGISRRRNGDLREMVRALTLIPWFNTAEDAKRRDCGNIALAAIGQENCWQCGTMGRQIALMLYVLALVGVMVGVDILFFRNRVWERLMVNVGIVLVFAAFYLRFLKSP
jgi:hypothetical protein